jgi:hypothetical protein
MLHPTGVREKLGEFFLRRAAHMAFVIEENTAVAGGTRIQRHDIAFHTKPPEGKSYCLSV